MNDKIVPALIGGVILGVLSAIPFVQYCCCIWAIGGGVLAVMMYVKKAPTKVSVGEGAMLGAMAGLIGGVIYFVLASIIALIVGTAALEAAMKQAGIDMPLSGIAMILVGAFVGALILLALATGGGALGIPIFEKRKDGDVPPPPPTFGGQPGGGGYPGGPGQPGGGGYPGGPGQSGGGQPGGGQPGGGGYAGGGGNYGAGT